MRFLLSFSLSISLVPSSLWADAFGLDVVLQSTQTRCQTVLKRLQESPEPSPRFEVLRREADSNVRVKFVFRFPKMVSWALGSLRGKRAENQPQEIDSSQVLMDVWEPGSQRENGLEVHQFIPPEGLSEPRYLILQVERSGPLGVSTETFEVEVIEGTWPEFLSGETTRFRLTQKGEQQYVWAQVARWKREGRARFDQIKEQVRQEYGEDYANRMDDRNLRIRVELLTPLEYAGTRELLAANGPHLRISQSILIGKP